MCLTDSLAQRFQQRLNLCAKAKRFLKKIIFNSLILHAMQDRKVNLDALPDLLTLQSD
jgi:hypothetical protein